MSRTLSTTGKQAIFAADTDAVFVHLLVITTNDSPQSTIRLVDNIDNVTYGGNTYSAYPFSIILPTDENGVVTEARIVLDNVSRTLIDEVRGLTNTLSLDIYVVDASQNPVTLEASFTGFTMKNVAYDALSITARLSIEDYVAEPFPKDVLSGSKFPGLV